MFFRVLCLLSLFVSSFAFGRVIIEKQGDTLKYIFEVEDVNFKDITLDKRGFVKAELKGVDGYTGVLYKAGAPEVPVIRFFTDGGDVRVITKNEASVMTSDHPLVPNQLSVPKIKGTMVPFTVDNRAYKSDEYYPAKLFALEDVGSVRGVPRIQISLYPVSYNPTENKYKVIKRFEVLIRDLPTATSTKSTMLYLIGQAFDGSPSLRDYIEFKEGLGLKSRSLIVSKGMTADQIRVKIKEAYANDPTIKYALIIGDSEDVPGYKSSTIHSYMTDHYYSAIDTADYQTDINAPDLGVGRVAVKNEAQLEAVLGKFKRYQASSNDPWVQWAAFLATDDRYVIAEGSHNYAVDTYTKAAGYMGIFPSAQQDGGDKLYAITYKVPNETVQAALRQGRSIVNYSGHGATTYWDAPRVTPENVRALSSDALPFVISNACVTGQYTVQESFAETWQRHPQGAITFWGSADSTYWDEDDILERAMFDKIFKEKITTFAGITQNSLKEVWKHYGGANRSKYYWETYIVFGDPSISLKTN